MPRSRAVVFAVVGTVGIALLGAFLVRGRSAPYHGHEEAPAAVAASEEPGPARPALVQAARRPTPPVFRTDDKALSALVNARTESDVAPAEAARVRALASVQEGRPEGVYEA